MKSPKQTLLSSAGALEMVHIPCERTELKVFDNVFSDYIRMKHVLYIPYAAPYALNVSSKQMAGTAGVLWTSPGAVRA
jgi:hypothetical protein